MAMSRVLGFSSEGAATAAVTDGAPRTGNGAQEQALGSERSLHRREAPAGFPLSGHLSLETTENSFADPA